MCSGTYDAPCIISSLFSASLYKAEPTFILGNFNCNPSKTSDLQPIKNEHNSCFLLVSGNPSRLGCG